MRFSVFGGLLTLVESRFSQPPGDNGPGSGDTHARPPAGGGLGGVVENVGARVQEILDIAERVAGDIRAEAEAASERQVSESRREAERVVDERIGELASLTRSLTGRVDAVEREARALIAELDGARERLARMGGQPTGIEAPVVRTAPAEVAPMAPPEDGAESSSGQDRDEIPERAILRATQMAVAGVDRTEIEHMLRSEFGVDDAMTVVDKMLRSERA